MQLKYMTGEEFVRKLLNGERDFLGIKLEEYFDLSGCESFNDLNKYLKKQELYKNPVDISGSVFEYIKAKGLFLPYVRGVEANLVGANLGKANLGKANLGKANLRVAGLLGASLWEANLGKANLLGVDFREANLWGADFRKANLMGADFRKANLMGADFRKANLMGADLRGVKNLESVINLMHAHFNQTIVTSKEKEIIESALDIEQLFIVR